MTYINYSIFMKELSASFKRTMISCRILKCQQDNVEKKDTIQAQSPKKLKVNKWAKVNANKKMLASKGKPLPIYIDKGWNAPFAILFSSIFTPVCMCVFS